MPLLMTMPCGHWDRRSGMEECAVMVDEWGKDGPFLCLQLIFDSL